MRAAVWMWLYRAKLRQRLRVMRLAIRGYRDASAFDAAAAFMSWFASKQKKLPAQFVIANAMIDYNKAASLEYMTRAVLDLAGSIAAKIEAEAFAAALREDWRMRCRNP